MHFCSGKGKSPVLLLSLFILLISCFPVCYGDIYIKNENYTVYLTNLYILESEYEPGAYISGDLSHLDFIPYSGGALPVTFKATRRMYTFSGSFTIDPSLSNILLSIYLGPSSYPYNLYINGKQVLSRGSRDVNNYQSASYDSVNIQLYKNLLRIPGQPNDLVIQAYPLEENAPLEKLIISSDLNVSRMVFLRNLFNVHFIQAFFCIGLLIGIYFLFHFAARGLIDRHYFYFALLCFFFSLCYYNISFSYNLANQLILEKVSRLSFPMACLFLTLFIRELTGIAKKLWVLALISIPSLISSFIILLKNSFLKIDDFFNSTVMIYLLPPLLIFSFTMLIISYFRTHKSSYLIIMIAFILIFAASLHDMTYIILHSNPFCWLVPYSYFCLLISIFIVLALEESLMYTDLQKKSTEIDGKNTTMKRIIQQIELVTKNLVHSSRNLEENIVKAVNVIRSSSRNNNLLSDRLLSQLQEIGNATIQIAAKMEIAMEKIPGAISNQTSAVEETNRAVSDMNNHIENILKNMVKTNEITQELSTIASSVRNIVLKSKDSIKLVAENSKFIGEILINIQEIVEESNFLSMNASIESAHAGIAGRGFSILANEIRELANKSKERLEMSQDRLNQMLKFINESITLSEEVTNQLLIIIEKSGTSAEMIEKITELMSNHRMESGNILKGAATLLQNTLTIKDMADNDQKEYESIKQVLSTLKESFVDMSNLLKNQVNSENNIRDAMDNIQEVLSNSLKAMDMLNESVKIAGNDQYQEQF